MPNKIFHLLILFFFLPSLSWGQNQTSRNRHISLDLDASSLTFTTDFNTVSTWYLSHVAVNFNSAPESVETVVIMVSPVDRSADFNIELISLSTEAGVTKTLVFLFNRGVPLNSGDQVIVTVTNISQSVNEPNDDPVVNVFVVVDLNPGILTNIVVFRNGEQVKLIPNIDDMGVISVDPMTGAITFTVAGTAKLIMFPDEQEITDRDILE